LVPTRHVFRLIEAAISDIAQILFLSKMGIFSNIVAAALVASQPEAVSASRVLRRNVRNVAHNASVAVVADAANRTQMEEMDVPVLVVVVDGAEYTNGTEVQGQGRVEKSPLTPACQKEMSELKSDEKRATRAQKCEQDTDAKKVVQMLSDADLDGATSKVASTFQTCGNITKSCSNEVAPHIVMMVRLSGMAISDKCKEIAAKTEAAHKAPEKCQGVMMQSVFEKLQKHDLDGALDNANKGLDSCVKMEKPCDFQFAPVLVSQILQAVQAREMEEEAAEITYLIARQMNASRANASKVEAAVKPDVAPTKKAAAVAVAPKKGTKAISLLKVSEKLAIQHVSRRISSFF